MNDDTMKKVLAELIGTFTLVFIGAGAGALAGENAGGGGIVAVALAHGLAVLTSIYMWGSISGCHINPAVTLGLLVTGRIDIVKSVLYWIAQFIGGIAAAYLLLYVLPSDITATTLGETVGVLTRTDPLKTVVVEAVMTFFLVCAVFASGVDGRNGNAAGVAIGLVVSMDILCGGYLTGAGMNPARTLGPALAMKHFDYLWMYFVGPFVGAAVAALLYDKLFLPAELKPPVKAAETDTNRRR
jgi:MIP family channel proteins